MTSSRSYNEQIVAEAAGFLKEIPFRDIEYLPVTCSHTFAAVNIVEGGGPGLHEELCNEEGNIDKSKMQGRKEKESELPACPDLPAYDYMHVVFAGMSLKRRCNSWP